MSTYKVRYLNRFVAQRGGRAVALRVWENEEFFQTFHATATPPDDGPDDRWWAALAVLGVDAIQAAVEGGFEPGPDPTQGFTVRVDADEVVRRAAADEPLPALVDGNRRGIDMGTFDA